MKTLGWAAIVYYVRDAYTFGALVSLIVGEIAVTFMLRHRPQRRTPLNFQKLSNGV